MVKPRIVFYLTNQHIGGKSGSIKILYVEYEEYFLEQRCMSPLPVDIPLDLQFHLDIGTQIANNVFEVNNPNVTERDFMRAGFVKNMNFIQMIEEYQSDVK